MIAATIKPWIMAARPKTLVATFAPIMIGASFAFREGSVEKINLVAALVSALFIQIGTNLANDFYDFKKGADTAERVGPIRVTQSGLIKAQSVLTAFVLCFALAALFGLYLVVDVGAVILWVGIASIISGIAYTAGPWPLAYVGLGEVFVLCFFGPVASGFTYYVMTHALNPVAFWVGLAPGALSCAILVANNLRDVEQDKKSNKRTLVVRFGKNFARAEYALLWLLAYAVCIVVALHFDNLKLLLPFLTAPLAFGLCIRIFKNQPPSEMIRILEGTAKGLALFTILYCVALSL